jgi:hypothetical protein
MRYIKTRLKMITANLIGCLGNQLYGVATAYALALDNNDECAFNFYYREEDGLSGHGPKAYIGNIYKKLKQLPNEWQPEYIYSEPVIGCDYVPIPYHPNISLNGYFSSVKYFEHRRKEILELFKDKDVFDTIKNDFTNSVSLHIRRGDYINKPTIHPFLTVDYYNKAMEYIENHAHIDKIFLFTEDRDLDWCRNNFKDSRIKYTNGLPDYIHLYMMSLCNHNIIANSSFGAWGSWLNEHNDKIIVSPKKWHGPGLTFNATAFYCDNWILIDN